jgi:hypothetical protein
MLHSLEMTKTERQGQRASRRWFVISSDCQSTPRPFAIISSKPEVGT